MPELGEQFQFLRYRRRSRQLEPAKRFWCQILIHLRSNQRFGYSEFRLGLYLELFSRLQQLLNRHLRSPSPWRMRLIAMLQLDTWFWNLRHRLRRLVPLQQLRRKFPVLPRAQSWLEESKE